MGLLLLRIAVTAMFVLSVTQRLDFSSDVVFALVVSLTALISLGLLVGFLTLVLSVIACVAALANLSLTTQTIEVIYALLTSAALFFLGPGAYSVDAKLYGLRVHVVPPRKDK